MAEYSKTPMFVDQMFVSPVAPVAPVAPAGTVLPIASLTPVVIAHPT